MGAIKHIGLQSYNTVTSHRINRRKNQNTRGTRFPISMFISPW